MHNVTIKEEFTFTTATATTTTITKSVSHVFKQSISIGSKSNEKFRSGEKR